MRAGVFVTDDEQAIRGASMTSDAGGGSFVKIWRLLSRTSHQRKG